FFGDDDLTLLLTNMSTCKPSHLFYHSLDHPAESLLLPHEVDGLLNACWKLHGYFKLAAAAAHGNGYFLHTSSSSVYRSCSNTLRRLRRSRLLRELLFLELRPPFLDHPSQILWPKELRWPVRRDQSMVIISSEIRADGLPRPVH